MEPIDLTCKFCGKTASSYTCPRCNARYCSLLCYKCEVHASCSESFYRDCFMDGLRDMVADRSERDKMIQMLKRLENQHSAEYGDEFDEEDEASLEDRLAGIDLDCGHPDKILERLTVAERRQFEEMLNSGALADMVTLWVPWWNPDSRSLVEELSTEPKKPCTIIPSLLTEVPKLSQLNKSCVSELVPYCVVNAIYGYAYAARLYNGDHVSMALESVNTVLDISESLDRGVFPDFVTAVAGCLARLTEGPASDHFVSREYSIAVLTDVCRIIAGPNNTSSPLLYIAAALSDCHRMFKMARHQLGSRELTVGTGDKPEKLRQRYYAVQKKLEFFVVWLNEHGLVLKDAIPHLELEICELTSQLVTHCADKDKVVGYLEQRRLKESRALITEIA